VYSQRLPGAFSSPDFGGYHSLPASSHSYSMPSPCGTARATVCLPRAAPRELPRAFPARHCASYSVSPRAAPRELQRAFPARHRTSYSVPSPRGHYKDFAVPSHKDLAVPFPGLSSAVLRILQSLPKDLAVPFKDLSVPFTRT